MNGNNNQYNPYNQYSNNVVPPVQPAVPNQNIPVQPSVQQTPINTKTSFTQATMPITNEPLDNIVTPVTGTTPNTTNKSNKGKKKIIIIINLIALLVLVIGIVLFIFNNNNNNDDDTNKEDDEKTESKLDTQLARQMNIIGQKAEHYIDSQVGKPGPTEVKKYLDKTYNFDCEIFEVYKNGTVYLSKCSIDGSDPLYSYGKEQNVEKVEDKVEENTEENNSEDVTNVGYKGPKFEYTELTMDLYEGYEKVALSAPDKYEPSITYFSDNSTINSLGKIDEEEIEGKVKVNNGKATIEFSDEVIEIANISNVRKALVGNSNACEGSYSTIFLLDDGGNIYIYNITSKTYNNIEALKTAIEKVIEKDGKQSLTNKYTNITLGRTNESLKGCEMSYQLFGQTSNGIKYIIEETKETEVEKYFPYSHKGAEVYGINYYVDLEGNVNLRPTEDKRIYLGIQAMYVIGDVTVGSEDSGKHCEIVISNDKYVYVFCDYEGDSEEDFLLKKSALYQMHYSNFKVDGEKQTNVILTFTDDTILVLDNVTTTFRELY